MSIAAPRRYIRAMTPFIKMHGCGNDFVVFDERAASLDLSPARAAALADRRTGIGCDQLIVIEPCAGPADAFMRIRNPDGSEAGACGNATRCVAALLAPAGGRVTIRTIAGDLAAEALPDGRVAADMGEPRLGWRDIPLAREADTLHLPLPGDPAGLSMGNPHATFFGPEPSDRELAAAESLETDELFPDRCNIGFATVLAPHRIRLRMWERGAGVTRACGSGACAALVNAHRRGLSERRATVVLDGGELEIEWRDDGGVLMTGPVATSFAGSVDLRAFPA